MATEVLDRREPDGRGLAVTPADAVDAAGASNMHCISATTGLPEIRSTRPVMAEDVRSLQDD